MSNSVFYLVEQEQQGEGLSAKWWCGYNAWTERFDLVPEEFRFKAREWAEATYENFRYKHDTFEKKPYKITEHAMIGESKPDVRERAENFTLKRMPQWIGINSRLVNDLLIDFAAEELSAFVREVEAEAVRNEWCGDTAWKQAFLRVLKERG